MATTTASTRSNIVFALNGKRCEVVDPEPETTLLDFLRREKRLTAAKLGCGEGGCGACTVLVSRYEHGDATLRHRSINACLMPLCAVDGCAVTTAEGIGSSADPHPVQERIAKLHGSQCGFCTPGIVMALYSKLQDTATTKSGAAPTVADIEECFDGNLCRCTGYRPILDAAKTFASDGAEAIPDRCGSCPNAEACGVAALPSGAEFVSTSSRSKALEPRSEEVMKAALDSRAAPSLPPSISDGAKDELLIRGRNGVTWYRPATLQALLGYVQQNPTARLVVGNSEIGIETKFKGITPPLLVSVASIAELHTVTSTVDAIVIGAAAPLATVAEALERLHPTPMSSVASVTSMLRWFASSQIRHVACLGGNLCTASPIGDLAPILLAVGATLDVVSAEGGARTIPMAEWIAGYRRVTLRPGEVLRSVSLPTPANSDATCFVKAFKQARRRDDDISIVTSAFAATRHSNGTITVTSGHGGVAPTTSRFADLDAELTAVLNEQGADETARVVAAVAKAIVMGPSTPGGMPAYRRTLVASMALRFLRLARSHFFGTSDAAAVTTAADDADFLESPHPMTSGVQRYIKDVAGNNLTHARPTPFVRVADGEPRHRGTVGDPETHSSALLQCTGEAKYVDDVVLPGDALYGVFVWSDRPRGAFALEGTAEAEAAPGVHVVFTAADLTPAQNAQGLAPVLDEELFRVNTVTAVGQAIALVGAETLEQARAAAKRIRVVYAVAAEAVVATIADAEAAGTRLAGDHPSLHDGDAAAALSDPDVVVVSGEVRVAGQDHFYLETTAAAAIPTEADELEVLCTTQFCGAVHTAVSRTTGLPQHKVIVKAKRIGGAFGGKETRPTWLACAVAVAAQKCRRPVRVSLERWEDMQTQGTRHPFYAKYRMGATKAGKIVAFDVDLHNNTGHSADLGIAVMGRALYNIAGPYKLPNLRADGHVWQTNTGSNTGFRGFGGPQATLIVETAVEHVASAIGMDPHTFRRLNLIQEGDHTHYGQKIKGQTLNRLWDAAVSPANADYDARRTAIDVFNRTHTTKKRGMAMTAVLYGVGLPGALHHASALVNIYLDGTVFISHGGVEMGQGLNVKVMQVVAAALGVSLSRVFVKEMDTSKIPNAAPSAGSVSFDLYGMAALDACEKLNERLAPYRLATESPERPTRVDDAAFTRAVNAAYNAKTPLNATGYTAGRVPEADGSPGVDIGFDFNKPVSRGPLSNALKGTPMQYYTQGVGCSEVELDTVTGDYRVVRTDIVMDIGSCASPGVDIGQIEGAFVQGMGLYTLEETIWGSKTEHPWLPAGQCFTKGPGNYKIPSFNDVPVDFRVSLLGGAPNPRGIHGSKAVGEPPLLLAASAFLAVKDAIVAAREVNGASQPGRFFPVDSPLSAERARLACADPIANFFIADNVAKGGHERAAIFV